jgi:hypothetical protein
MSQIAGRRSPPGGRCRGGSAASAARLLDALAGVASQTIDGGGSAAAACSYVLAANRSPGGPWFRAVCQASGFSGDGVRMTVDGALVTLPGMRQVLQSRFVT